MSRSSLYFASDPFSSPHRDFEKTGTTSELLKENLKIDSVLIVVPYGMDSVTKESSGLTIVELSELVEFLEAN